VKRCEVYGDGAGTFLLIISDFPCSYKYLLFALSCVIREEKEARLTKHYTRNKPPTGILSMTKLSKIMPVEIEEIDVLRDLCRT